MYNRRSSSPNLYNVNISNNSTTRNGGGIYNRMSSNPNMTNVAIVNNTASDGGGGIYNERSSNPKLSNVTISDNSASHKGGGIYNDGSTLTITNVTLSGNQAKEGGAIFNNNDINSIFTNCTIVNNSATYGGGIYNSNSSPFIRNSIFWDNTASESGDDYTNIGTSSPDVSWSIFKRIYPGGDNIITDDPLLQPLADNGGFTKTHAIPSYSPAIVIPLSAGGGFWNNSPSYDQRGERRSRELRTIGAYEIGSEYPDIIYVDASASPGGDGSSWDNAFNELNLGIHAAMPGDHVWVAAGTYTPQTRPNPVSEEYEDDPRSVHFSLKNEVAVYGCFSGTEINFSQRNCKNNLTVLSGDIGEPDDNSDNSYHVFYHPEGIDLNETAVLDGVKITGGNADGGSPHNLGGGMYNSYNSPTLNNVIIYDNRASSGGGIYNSYSTPIINNVTISGNSAVGLSFGRDFGGGGMYNSFSNPILNNVTISGNRAIRMMSGIGGGIYNSSSSPLLINVTISDNIVNGGLGSGIYNYNTSSKPVVKNAIIWGNEDDPIYNEWDASPVISWSIVQGGYQYGTNVITDDPLLQPLADNGGFTKTHAIPSDSPAYAIPQSAGDGNWNDAPDTDQRGMSRATSGYRAIGSYEASDLPVAGTPSFIQVPSTSSTGNYTINWGSSSTSGVTYFLEEATNSTFTSDLRTAYTGSNLSASITGRSDGTYYYRVKATKDGYEDSEWEVGGNGCTVGGTLTDMEKAELIFAEAERLYPDWFYPQGQLIQEYDGYEHRMIYRYYPDTEIFLLTYDGGVYYYYAGRYYQWGTVQEWLEWMD